MESRIDERGYFVLVGAGALDWVEDGEVDTVEQKKG